MLPWPYADNPPIAGAFVLGAGLGTRLKKLTETRPKPLIPLAGKPLITSAFDHLLAAGIKRIVVNTHHRAEAYAREFPGGIYRAASLTFRHEPILLETGGGIKNVEDLLGGEPFIVYNGDLFTTLPLEPAIAHHLASGNEATLILRSGGGPLHIAFREQSKTGGGRFAVGAVADIRQRLGRATGTHLFTGVYLVSPAFLKRLRLEKASVVPTFLQMIEEGASLGAIVIDEGEWWDLGTREQYLEAHRHLRGIDPNTSWIAPGAKVAPGVRITGATYLGAGSEIGPGVRLHDSILWEGTKIAKESVLEHCIVTDGQSVGGIHSHVDF